MRLWFVFGVPTIERVRLFVVKNRALGDAIWFRRIDPFEMRPIAARDGRLPLSLQLGAASAQEREYSQPQRENSLWFLI